MADLPTRTALFAAGRRSIVSTPGLRINTKVIDTDGSDINILLGAMALMCEEDVAAFSACMRTLFVETAADEALDKVAFDRYQLTRDPAAAATVTLTLSRPTFTFGAFVYPAGGRVQTADGTQFATDVDTVFGGADLVKTVSATALVAGPDGNVQTATLTRFADAPADATLTVTNAAGAAGGVTAESDPEFRSRILAFFPTIRRGTLGAIEFGALAVPGVAVAKAFEIVNLCCGIGTTPAAAVELVIADQNGGFSEPLIQQVKNSLLEFRAAGIPVSVVGGNVSFQAIEWDVDYDTGVDTVAAQASLRAVTVAVAQTLRPGAVLYRSSLVSAARTIPGIIVRDNSLVAPVGDVVPIDNTQVIRIRETDVTFSP